MSVVFLIYKIMMFVLSYWPYSLPTHNIFLTMLYRWTSLIHKFFIFIQQHRSLGTPNFVQPEASGGNKSWEQPPWVTGAHRFHRPLEVLEMNFWKTRSVSLRLPQAVLWSREALHSLHRFPGLFYTGTKPKKIFCEVCQTRPMGCNLEALIYIKIFAWLEAGYKIWVPHTAV